MATGYKKGELMAKIIFDEERCKGCGLCETACPKKLITLKKDSINAKGYHPANVTDESLCIGCGSCAIMCPDAIITVER